MYHEARAAQQAGIVRFESEYGRADRIDASLLADLQRLQMRFAGIAARQHRHAYAQEPKVSKFVDSLGDVIGKVTVHLATENALELFAPINEQDYIGYAGRVGTKGYDEAALAGYRIVDDPSGPVAAAPSREGDDDDSVCLHESIEAFEDNPTRGLCDEFGAEFDLAANREASTEAEDAADRRVKMGSAAHVKACAATLARPLAAAREAHFDACDLDDRTTCPRCSELVGGEIGARLSRVRRRIMHEHVDVGVRR